MKKLIAILLTITMLSALLCACGGSAGPSGTGGSSSGAGGSGAGAASDAAGDSGSDPFADVEPRELIVASTRGEGPDAALIAYTERITERTGGKITFSFFFGGSLAKASEAVDALQNGICDIMMVNVSNFENLFPLNCNALAIPFMGMSNETTQVYEDLAAMHPELGAEFDAQNLHVLSYSMTAPYNLHLYSDKEIRVPSDLTGMKLICLQENIMNFLSAQNCAPVQVDFADFYTSIQGGVADGIVQNAGPVYSQGIQDLVNQHLIFGEDGGLYMELVTYCMNGDVWASLEPAVQAVFTEEAAQFHEDDQGVLYNTAQQLKATAIEMGNRYWEMTEEEMEPWKEAMMPYIQDKIDEISGRSGCETFPEIYADALELIAQAKG